MRQHIVCNCYKRIFFVKHGSILVNDCQTIHIRIDNKTHIYVIFTDNSGRPDKISGIGSGVWAKCPFDSQLISTIVETPSAFRSWGTIIPPTELTASTATLNLSL